jgi:Rhs element Vgr protein
MADSPLHSKIDLPSFSILIGGKEIKQSYQVISIEIEKEVNRVSKARIVIADGKPTEETFPVSEAADFEPGKEVKIKLGYHSTDADAFSGVITSQQLRFRSADKTSELEVVCHDKAFQMTLGRKSATFKEMKDSEVISKVVKDNSLKVKVKATTFKFPLMVQYNSSDWDFVLTRADANGHIVINEGGELDVGPPEVSGSEALEVNYGKDVFDFDAELDSTEQLLSVSAEAWDAKTGKMLSGASKEPSVGSHGNIDGKKLAKVAGNPKYEIKTSAADPKEELEALANAILLRNRMGRLKGHVSFPGSTKAEVGKLIKLAGFGARFNGIAYISSVHHELESGFWTTTVGFGIDSRPYADEGSISGPSAAGLIPGVSGIHIGKVDKITEDPDSQFRVSVSVPSLNIEKDKVWARLAFPYASNGIGMYFFPEVGDEVLLGFLDNDPRNAVILGSVYGPKNKAPFTPDKDNKDKAIITKEKLMVSFDDKDKIITIETPGGQKVTLDDKGKSLTLEDQNKNKVDMSSSGISLTSNKDIKLDSKGAITISAVKKIDMKASGGDVAMEGLNIKSKAKIGLTAEGTATAELKASGNVTVKGAMVMIN